MYARWIPFKERTRAIAITNSGIPAGTIFAYVISAIIIASYSWEWVFYSFGALGLIWFFFWQKDIHSYPEQDKNISLEELTLIKDEAPADSNANKIPLLSLLTNLPFLSKLMLLQLLVMSLHAPLMTKILDMSEKLKKPNLMI